MTSIQKLIFIGLVAGLTTASAQSIDPFSFPTATRTGTYGPFQLNVVGGPAIWSVSSGALPPGLTLSSSGVVSGTVLASALQPSYLFTAAATIGSNTGTREFTISVVAPPILNIISVGITLPGAQGNSPYSATLANFFNISGGVSPYRYEVASGVEGFRISSNGASLIGAPRVAEGGYSFTFIVRDANGAASNGEPIGITVTNLEPSLAPSSLPSGTLGQPYSNNVSGSNGGGLYAYDVVTGNVPPGLRLDTKLACPEFVNNLTYQTGTYVRATAGLSGGTGPRDFSLTGSLPTGITLSPNGTLSGIATSSGTFNYRIAARDPNGLGVYRDCSVQVTPQSVAINSVCPLDSANLSSFYSSGFTVQNTLSAPAFYQILSGELPSGLTLSSTNGEITGIPTGSPGLASYTIRAAFANSNIDRSCSIRTYSNSQSISSSSLLGVPAQAGTFVFTARLTPEFGPAAVNQYTVTINPALSLSTVTLPSGAIGTAYSTALIPTGLSGGTAPFTYSLATGVLPPNLALNTAGLISGNPIASGTFNFSVRVTDASGAQSTAPLSITITNPSNFLQITTASLPVGIVGQTYPATQVAASGGSGGGYNFFFFSEFNPPGLSISSSGLISGLPNQTGIYNVSVGVSDNTSGFASRPLPIVITTFSCPNSSAQTGVAYSGQISLSPFAATSYAISGSLPSGLTLNAASGSISGTTSSVGTSTFQVTAFDAPGRQVSRSCSITAESELQTTSSRTTARFNIPYRSSLSTTGGTGSYSHTIVSGKLPDGLTLDTATGLITGTPTTVGSSPFRVRSVDTANRVTEQDITTYVLARDFQPLLRCPLPSSGSNRLYNSALSLNGEGTATFQISGALPPGLTLNPATGRITGTATSSGTYTFTASATGVAATPLTASCQIEIPDSTRARLAVACPDQSDLVLGEPYASPAIASGGRPPYTYSLYESSLPNGLTLNTATGLISGTLTAGQSFTYAIAVSDNNEGFSFTNPSCTTTVLTAPPLSILTESLPGGIVGANYSATVAISGGTPPYTASLAGSLPAGLQAVVSGNTVNITSSGLTSGPIALRLIVRDSARQSAFRDYVIQLSASDPLRLTTNVLNGATVGIGYQERILAEGGSTPYRFSLSGQTPPGITFNADGTFTGSPTTAGTWRFDIEVIDAAGTRVARTYALSVFQGNFRLGCPNLQAEVGVTYSSAANVIGGSQPYTFSISNGQLPGGLNLDTLTGGIGGRPTTAGAFVFTFGVSDARQARTQTQCSIGVLNGALRIVTEGPVTTRAGEPYQGQFEAAGGTGPYQWSLTNAPAEAGLTVAQNGAFTGRATKKGTFSVLLQVRDAAGATASRTLSLIATDSSLTLACPLVSSFQLGVSATGTFVLTGGVAPYRVTLVSGTLPSGFDLSSSGQFTVRSLAAGSFQAQLQAVDDTNTAVTTRCPFEVTGESLTITTESLPDGRVGTSYSGGVSSRGGVGRVRYSLSSGGLPAGLEFDTATGAIAGTPEVDGTFALGVSALDEAARRATKILNLRVEPGALPFRITTASPLSDGFVGRPYSGGFAAEGGRAPYTFTIGGLPAGLTASGDSFSGTPSQAGDASVAVTVRDATGATASKSFLLRVKADGLTIVTESLPDGVEGQTYGVAVTREGGTAPFSWSLVNGAIPPGVTFNSANGSFEGSPSRSGSYSLTVEVYDATGATSRRSYSFEVRPPGIDRLSITTATLPSGNAGVSYTTSVGATGGQEPYTWTVNGDLPSGLSFATSGAISGTPLTVGTTSFVVTVTDALGLRATRLLSLRIGTDAVPGLSIDGLPDTASVNQNLPVTLRLASPFGVPVTGRLTLVFVPDTIHGADDPAIRFASATRTLDFTIPAGSTAVTIAGSASLSTGTLAGTIRLDSVLNFAGTSAPGPSRSIALRRAVPTISNLRLTRTTGGLEIRIEGFTNTRQLSEARVTFTASGSVDLTTANQVTVNVASAIQSWFASAASTQFGGQFALTLPFTVTGDPAGITGVSVVITNSEGSSGTATAN